MRKTNITWKVNPSTVFAVVPEDYLEQSSGPERLPSIVETESKVVPENDAKSANLKQNQPTDGKLNEQALQVQRNNIASIKSLLVTEQNNCTRNQAQLKDDIAACQDNINGLNHEIYDLETKLNSLPALGQAQGQGPAIAQAPCAVPEAMPIGVATQGVTSVPGVPGTAQVIGTLPETNSSKISLDGRQTQSSEVAPLSVQSLGGNQVNPQQKAIATPAPNMATRGQNAPNNVSYIYDRQAQAQAQANAARTMSDNAQEQWSTSSFDQSQGLPQRPGKNQGYGQQQRQRLRQAQVQGFSQGQGQGRGQGRGYTQSTVPMSAKPQNDPRYGQMGVPEANGTQYGVMGPQGGNMPPYAVPNRAQYGAQGSMGAPMNMPMANGPQYGAMGPQGGNWPYYGAPQGPQAQYSAMGPQSGNWPHYGAPQGPQAQYGANGPQYGAPQGPQAQYGAMGPQGANGPQYGVPQGPQAQYGAMGPQGSNGLQYGAPQGAQAQYGAPQGPQYGVPYGAFDPAANAAQRAWAQQMAMEQQMALEQQMAMEQQQRAMMAMGQGQQFNYMNMPVAPRPHMGAFYGNYVAPSTQDQYWEQPLPNGLTYRPDADLYIMIDQRFDYLHNLMKTLAVRGIRIMLFNNMCLYDRNDIILLPYRFDPLPSDHVFVYGADKQSLWKWLKAEFSFRNINLSAKS